MYSIVSNRESIRSEGKAGLRQILPLFEENNVLFDKNQLRNLSKSSFAAVEYLFHDHSLLIGVKNAKS